MQALLSRKALNMLVQRSEELVEWLEVLEIRSQTRLSPPTIQLRTTAVVPLVQPLVLHRASEVLESQLLQASVALQSPVITLERALLSASDTTLVEPLRAAASSTETLKLRVAERKSTGLNIFTCQHRFLSTTNKTID